MHATAAAFTIQHALDSALVWWRPKFGGGHTSGVNYQANIDAFDGGAFDGCGTIGVRFGIVTLLRLRRS